LKEIAKQFVGNMMKQIK